MDKQPSRIRSVRITDREWQIFRTAARQQRMTVSELIRISVRQSLQRWYQQRTVEQDHERSP